MRSFPGGEYTGILANCLFLAVSGYLLKHSVYIFNASFYVGNKHHVDTVFDGGE